MNNDSIRKNLSSRRNKCLITLNNNENLDPFFKEILQAFNAFDFETYKRNLEVQILANLDDWWANLEKGIKKEEELYAILFQYNYYFQKNVEALTYGIGKWENYQVRDDKFSMNHSYDFNTNFYACPGVTLNFFESLEALDYDNLPSAYTNDHIDYDELIKQETIDPDLFNDIEEIEGYQELIELHKCKGMLAIHDVLVKIDAADGFEVLNYKDKFMFLIDEHDSGEVYPLLIKDK